MQLRHLQHLVPQSFSMSSMRTSHSMQQWRMRAHHARSRVLHRLRQLLHHPPPRHLRPGWFWVSLAGIHVPLDMSTLWIYPHAKHMLSRWATCGQEVRANITGQERITSKIILQHQMDAVSGFAMSRTGTPVITLP